jgi:nucleotide-binding universal stress UspA family protein
MSYIAIPLDGSPLAETAIPIASSIAWSRGIPLKLISAHPPALRDMHAIGAPSLDSALDATIRRKLVQYLDEVAARLATEPGLTVQTAVVDGLPGTALTAEFAARPPELVVLTTHARGGFNRLWMGSVATDLARQTNVPLLLLRPESDRSMWSSAFTRVLIPLDGSSQGEGVFEAALDLASRGASVALLRVIPATRDLTEMGTGELLMTDPDPVLREQAHDYLDAVAARLSAGGHITEQHVVVDTSPAQAIVNFARDWGADLIVMATHGRGPLGRLILGSVTDKVIRAANVPVMIQRPRHFQAEDELVVEDADVAFA